MPHKHTRRTQDPSTFDLPPTQVAKSLPVRDQQKDGKRKSSDTQGSKNLKRKRGASQKDDTPRAFKRLMAYADGKKPRSGLDNGDVPKRKNKKGNAKPEASGVVETKPKAEVPTIRPGERMSEFAARVDASLPITGLIGKSVKGNKDPLGLKPWRTLKEKKMHKLYDEWREEERKIKEKREEEMELAAEKELEDEENGVSWKLNMPQSIGGGKKKKKKAKSTKYLGEVGDEEEDPWEALRKKRGETRPGLHDVAEAPPELHAKLPKKLTVRGAAVEVDGIPKAAGSLRRREELQSVRDDVVASYRKLMSEKRPSLHTIS
ncbi:hypothetical protein F4780DRAFT_725786 [Xylariomycetidae sp. FL0641]|nr:hypothetical protein F4780DRAFT_725786 [Xylariomycetidae sp. FL0641]